MLENFKRTKLSLWMVLTVFFLLGSSLFTAEIRVEKEGKQTEIVMENETWKLVFLPQKGGRARKFVFKPSGRDWGCPGIGGAFQDHVTQQAWPGELLEREYGYKVLQAKGKEVSLELSTEITGNWEKIKGDKSIAGLQFKKTFILRDQDPRLQVKYLFKNPTGEIKTPVPWIQHILHIGGDKEHDHYYRPASQGLQHDYVEWKNNRITRHGNDFLRKPTGGWSAFIDHEKQEGAVFLMDYNDLYWLYNCMSASTIEWWYDPITLLPGKEWETDVWLIPITNLKSVGYADQNIVSDLILKIKNSQLFIDMSFFSAKHSTLKNVNIELKSYAFPDNRLLWEKKFKIDELGKKVITRSFTGPKLNPPNQEVIVKAMIASGKYKAEFERHIDPDEKHKIQFSLPLSNYRMPKKRKVKNFIIPKNLVVKKSNVPEVLVFEGLHYSSWNVDEILKEMGAGQPKKSYHSIFVYGDQLNWRPGQLADLFKYNLVVVGNVPAEAFTETVLQMLEIYVKNGGSILFLGGLASYGTGGYAESYFQEWLPVTSKEKFDLIWKPRGCPIETKKLKNTGKNSLILTPLTRAQVKPMVFWYHQFAKIKGTEVLSADDNPMLITDNIGKGRIAVFAMTPCGDPPAGTKGFWAHPQYRKWLKKTINWLIKVKIPKERIMNKSMIKIWVFLFVVTQVFLLFAESGKQLGIKSVSTDRIRYINGNKACFETILYNKSSQTWLGQVNAEIETGLTVCTPLGTRKVAIASGGEVILRWKTWIKLPDFGHSFRVKLVDQKNQLVDSRRAIFCVGEDYFNLGNYITIFGMSKFVSADQIRDSKFMKNIHQRHITVVEFYSVSPGLWGCLIPKNSWWFSGQGYYPETLRGQKLLIDSLHDTGVAVQLYNIRHSSGNRAIELARKHPEYYIFYANGRINAHYNCKPFEKKMRVDGQEVTASLRSASFPILTWDRTVQDKTIDDVSDCLLFYNYDGVRWDGIEILNSYNYKGENVKNFNEDEINAEWHDRLEKGIKARVPYARINYNFGSIILDTANRIKRTHRTLGPGAYLLWESMRGFWHNPNHPYNNWNNFVDAVRFEADVTRREGNFQHFGWYGCKNVVQRTHTQAIYFALGGHWDTWNLCAYDAAGMRFGKYLWDREIRLINNPEKFIKVDDSEEKLWWKRFAAKLKGENGTTYIMTHLLNKPLSKLQDDENSKAPPIRKNIQVDLKLQPGQKLKSATWVNMDDPDRNWIHHLKVTKKNSMASVTVPSVTYWSLVVWEIQTVSK